MTMIRGLLFSILSTLSLLPASASENPTHLPYSKFSSVLTAPSDVYSSGWETVPAWQLDPGQGSLLYTYSRPFEELSPSMIREGVVVVFARGYDFEGISRREEKPLGLPFYMMPANEANPHPIAWSFAAEGGQVTVGLSMDKALQGGFEQAQKDIQLRYFVISPDFLRQHKLTAMAVRKMPYPQLVALLNTTP